MFVAAPAKPTILTPPRLSPVGRGPVTSDMHTELPHPSTLKRVVYDTIVASGPDGITSDDIVLATQRSRSGVSGAVNALVKDRHIWDSGTTRTTHLHADATVWTAESAPSAPDAPSHRDAPTEAALVRDDVSAQVGPEGVVTLRYGDVEVRATTGQTEFTVAVGGGNPLRLNGGPREVQDAVTVAVDALTGVDENAVRRAIDALLRPVAIVVDQALKAVE